ncbi:MAG: hypothetical protein WC479_08510 [Candidatus Izemoplasmatales bacterium]
MKPIDVNREVEFLEKAIEALKEGKVTPAAYAYELIWTGLQRMQGHELDLHVEDFSDAQLESLQWNSVSLDQFCHRIPKDKKIKLLNYSECPACGGTDLYSVYPTISGGKTEVHRCRACDALFGVCPDYETTLVMVKEESFDPKKPKRQEHTTVYFDFMWPDVKYPDGRRHGWFEPESKTVTQYG